MIAWRLAGMAAAVAAGMGAMGVRIGPPRRRPGDRWRRLAVAARGDTDLGISFRPRQAEAFGIDPRQAFDRLLEESFEVVRLAAYWDRIEPGPGRFDTAELDWQMAAAEGAGKRVIVGLGAVKNFGYPEFYVPAHHLSVPLREGSLVGPDSHPELLAAARAQLARLVHRYGEREVVVAWQVEHEPLDPLGMEHSWRLSAGFLAAEVAVVRELDPGRPVLINGFLPASPMVWLTQRWRTRGQGDSLAAAPRLGDVVGIDWYPRHALAGRGPVTAYLDAGPWARLVWRRSPGGPGPGGRRVMVVEGQAEPWEAVTVPPAPPGWVMSSCGPERVIENFNGCLHLARRAGWSLDAYLFWGAEYWLLRAARGDHAYLDAFRRVLEAP